MCRADGQVDTMEPSAVRVAKDFSSAASANSWAMPVEERVTAQSPSCTAIAVSTAACRSVCLSACAQSVSMSFVAFHHDIRWEQFYVAL